MLNAAVAEKLNPVLRAVVPSLVILGVLLWLAWNPVPYEQDQIAKAARLELMEKMSWEFQPLRGPRIYREELFSLYYLIQSGIHSLLKGNVFLEMNVAAAVAGAVFFFCVAVTLRRVYALPEWLTMMMAINTPAFLHVFGFGNEAAFSLMAFAFALWMLSSPTSGRAIAAGFATGLGFHCRPDLLFLLPLLLAWSWVRSPVSSAHRVRVMIAFSLTTLFVAAVHWAIFVREMPNSVSFPFGHNLKFMAALVFFPFSPVLLSAATLGAIWAARKRMWHCGVYLLVLIPIAYVIPMLSSPKYIAFLVVPLWVFAGFWLQKCGRWQGVLWSLFGATFWIWSFTPFGVSAGWAGAARYLPTDDGPLPTGSYWRFYQLVHEGFFQTRYPDEIAEAAVLMEHAQNHPEAVAIGNTTMQVIQYALVMRTHREKEDVGFVPWRSLLSTNEAYARTLPLVTSVPWRDTAPTNHPCLMIRSTYLRLGNFEPASLERLQGWLKQGRVRPIGNEQGVFPAAIEIGEHIPAEENSVLGARILFVASLAREFGYVARQRFLPGLAATRWLPDAAAVTSSLPATQAYEDAEFICFTNDIGQGRIYSSVVPLIYRGQNDPRRPATPH